jgi:hypothetical protein
MERGWRSTELVNDNDEIRNGRSEREANENGSERWCGHIPRQLND